MEDKKYYLIKTLSRTIRKDYENYVINRLYNRLDDLDIKPMTQKYVKRTLNGENGYALIDLYFPQFNIGIECKEEYHHLILQEEQDKLRTEDVISELTTYKELPITVYDKTLIELNNDIDMAVSYIRDKKNEQIKNNTFKKWEIISPLEYFKNKDVITINDDIEFHTITETSNIIFGTNYKFQQQSWFPIKTITDKRVMAWFPQLAIENENGFAAVSNGWNNTINDNKDIIIEYNEYGKNANDNFDKDIRVTFMKMKDKITNSFNYKFLGVFLPVSKIQGKVTYKRIDTEFKIVR